MRCVLPNTCISLHLNQQTLVPSAYLQTPHWSRLFIQEIVFFTQQFFSKAQQPPVGQGLLIIEDLLLHSDTPHSVGLLWTSDQPVAETST